MSGRVERVKVALGIKWSHSRPNKRWIRVWCIVGHEWYARNTRGDELDLGPWGAFNYLLPDSDGRFQQCGRCGKRRCSEQRVGDALRWLHARLLELERQADNG